MVEIQRIDRIYDDFRSMLEAELESHPVVPIAGAEDAFAWLKKGGILMGTTTGYHRRVSDMLLQGAGWSDKFQATVCSDAVFALALRLGHVASNPVVGTSVRGMGHNDHRENGAYSLNEVRQMLTLFSGQVAAAIGIAAFLGLRGPEMEALEPSDYDGEAMRIHRDTKTGNDERIPVIAPLRKLLPGWTERIKLEREEHAIRKGLEGTSLRWKGWYGFRRGLATNLYELGVPPEVACLILRNSKEVCSNHYIRLDAGKKKSEAMDKLEQAFERAAKVQQAEDKPLM